MAAAPCTAGALSRNSRQGLAAAVMGLGTVSAPFILMRAYKYINIYIYIWEVLQSNHMDVFGGAATARCPPACHQIKSFPAVSASSKSLQDPWQDGEGEGHISLSPAPRSPLSLKVGADRAGKKLCLHDHGPAKPGEELSTTQRCVQLGGQESD